MEIKDTERKETPVREEGKGKKKWLNRFLNFLMYGGWLLVIVVVFGIIVLFSVLRN